MEIKTSIEHWPLKKPFVITGHTFTHSDVLLVTVTENGLTGRGEACGAYYKNETPESMAAQVAAATAGLRELDRRKLPASLTGGARNAVDCALWDLEAKRSGKPAWQLAGLKKAPQPLPTTYTLGADTPAQMAAGAAAYADATHLKLKLTGDGTDAERVRAVRKARPDVWMMVDANQGFTLAGFHELLPSLVEARVSVIEQPFKVGRESDLDGLNSPIPIAADESVQGVADIAPLAGRVQVINIKLDKCGGLTEALAMVEESRRLGFKVMVGNMIGTSLSAAPGYLIGQLCDFVDLDGVLFISKDRTPGVSYSKGMVSCPSGLWG